MIGLPSGQVYLFDLITCPTIMSQGLLSSLIESKDVVKVTTFSSTLFGYLLMQFGYGRFATIARMKALRLTSVGVSSWRTCLIRR